jgi:hypothetical protein
MKFFHATAFAIYFFKMLVLYEEIRTIFRDSSSIPVDLICESAENKNSFSHHIAK